MRLTRYILAISFLGVAMLSAGCSTNDQTRKHPCYELEQEQARGSTDQALSVSRKTIEDKRIGCNQATQFMMIFSAVLYAEGVPLSASELRNYGNAWCDENYSKGSLPEDLGTASDAARKRVHVLNASMAKGCQFGIEASMLDTSGVVAFLLTPSGSGSSVRAIGRDTVDLLVERARAVVARLSQARYETEQVQGQLRDKQKTAQDLARTKEGLMQARAATEAARLHVLDVTIRRVQIFSDRDNSRLRAEQAMRVRQADEARVQPLQAARNEATSNERIAAAALSLVKSEFDSVTAQIKEARILAASARRDAENYRSKARMESR